MWKFLIVLFYSLLLNGNLHAIAHEKDSLFHEITMLSNRYLNCYHFAINDSVISTCRKAAKLATIQNNPIERFKAEQLIVNILCLKGDIDQGINMAKEMYQNAKESDHPLGKALALQAIGATYMHANQYQQARSTFAEANPLIFSEGDTISEINLTIQQLYTCSQLEDTTGMAVHLHRLQSLTANLPPELNDIYLFYTICYETMLQIKMGRLSEAQDNLQKLSQIQPNDANFNTWRYSITADIYQGLNKNDLALVYLDSILLQTNHTTHPHEHKDILYKKASLLEKARNYKEACRMYFLADSLTSVLDMEHYCEQIENLHLTYYSDEAAIQNARMRNDLLTSILIYSIIIMLIAAVLIIMAKKRNRQLAASRERLDHIRQITADSIQSKSIFLSNMSHDLRTPLNAIVGFSEILTTTEDIDSELKQQCRDYINQNSDLLMKLVNDIVDFSTLKEAEINFDFSNVDVVALCRNVVSTIAKVKQTEAELRFSTTIDKLIIETDSSRLQQVLINLLTNAAKFTKSGNIHLHIEHSHDEVTFTVEDTGCGIPLEKQPRIFERFEKLHESVQGVGLGLSICRLIVEHMNGKIWIDSTYTQGARFVFTHPITLGQNKNT